MTLTSEEYLQLADWRRRVAALYVEVRGIAAHDPVAAWDCWRETRGRLYREHIQSPVAAAQRPTFRANHFPYDPAMRFEVQVVADPDAEARATRLPANARENL